MVKDYFRSLLTAFRGSHKSVPQKLPINSNTTSSTGRGVNHPVTLFGLLRSCLAGKARHTITTRKARTLQPFAICASTQTRANSALLTGGF